MPADKRRILSASGHGVRGVKRGEVAYGAIIYTSHNVDFATSLAVASVKGPLLALNVACRGNQI